MMESVDHRSLYSLPNELIQKIIYFLDRRALLCLAEVDKYLHDVCATEIFKHVVIRFSTSGFRSLERLAVSRKSSNVRTLEYWTPRLLDPGTTQSNISVTNR